MTDQLTDQPTAQFMAVEGGCACGAVRYALQAKPMIVHACHCTDCQGVTGTAFALNAWIEKAHVKMLAGTLAGTLVSHGFSDAGSSGNGNSVHFCAQCGTYVWTEYMPGFWFVRVGTLDDPQQFAPDMHIWTRSKQPWMVLPEGVRSFEMSYDKEQEWPADSLARLAAVAG